MAINTNGINFEQLNFENGKLPAVNGNNLNQIQKNIKNAFNDLLNSIMPIGKIEMFFDNGDYSNYMGFKWKQVAEGRNLIGVGLGIDKSLNSKEFVIGNNDGEYLHKLVKAELPAVSNTISLMSTAEPYGSSSVNTYKGNVLVTEGGENDYDISTGNFGDGTAIDITNPSYGVYIWQRYE